MLLIWKLLLLLILRWYGCVFQVGLTVAIARLVWKHHCQIINSFALSYCSWFPSSHCCSYLLLLLFLVFLFIDWMRRLNTGLNVYTGSLRWCRIEDRCLRKLCRILLLILIIWYHFSLLWCLDCIGIAPDDVVTATDGRCLAAAAAPSVQVNLHPLLHNLLLWSCTAVASAQRNRISWPLFAVSFGGIVGNPERRLVVISWAINVFLLLSTQKRLTGAFEELLLFVPMLPSSDSLLILGFQLFNFKILSFGRLSCGRRLVVVDTLVHFLILLKSIRGRAAVYSVRIWHLRLRFKAKGCWSFIRLFHYGIICH